jgi:hypothetical protein
MALTDADNTFIGTNTFQDETVFSGPVLVEGVEGLSMEGGKISNLANGTLTTDAVNKGQLDAKTLITDNQIAVGTGTGIEGTTGLTWDNGGNLNIALDAASGSSKFNYGKLTLRGGFAGSGLVFNNHPSWNSNTFSTTLRHNASLLTADATITLPKKTGELAALNGYNTWTDQNIFNQDAYFGAETIFGADVMFEGSYTSMEGNTLQNVANGVNAGDAVNKSQLDAVKRPYKVYVALISQSGTSAPTAIVLENTLSGTPTFSYSTPGNYGILLTGEFIEDKTTYHIQPNGGSVDAYMSTPSINTVMMHTRLSGTQSNDVLLKTPIEIRVYN